ncbi:hypothetical protein JCM10213_006605 [Rhodosporidiobolus nylandii]
MERFSKWRDPATGVAPFLLPLPAGQDALPPAVRFAVFPFAALLGGARTLLVLLLLGAQALLVEGVLRVASPLPPVYSALSRAANASIARLILAVVGVLWIPTETVRLQRSGRSPPQVPFAPQKGDLIVPNSSSWVDLLYLAFRFNPTFVLPVLSPSTSASGKINGFRRVSLLTAVLSSGGLPQVQQDGGESLEEALRKAAGPVVLFPEATTSNNRALLKFAELSPASPSPTGGKPAVVRVFVLVFRYPAPTRFAPSLTHPIPSSPPLLPHLFTLTSRLLPLTFSIRRLHASECPRLTLPAGANPKKEEWDALAETLAGTGRLKRVGGLGWKEKEAFLEFRRVKGR